MLISTNSKVDGDFFYKFFKLIDKISDIKRTFYIDHHTITILQWLNFKLFLKIFI